MKPRALKNPEDLSRSQDTRTPQNGAFIYEVSSPTFVNIKRAILSAVSRIYDPLGLHEPLVTSAKVLIQKALKTGS